MTCVHMYDVVVLRVATEAWEPETGARVPVSPGTRGAVVAMSCPAEWITVECDAGLVDVRVKDVEPAEPVAA